MPQISYFGLAGHLRQLAITATCGEMVEAMKAFECSDKEYRDSLIAEVAALPKEENWLRGLWRLCDALKKDNPRFIPTLFMEWALEEI